MEAGNAAQRGSSLWEDDSDLEDITAFSFTNAIQTHKPVQVIEEIRSTLIRNCISDGAAITNLSRSDALKHAILNQYTEYAKWLLKNYTQESLVPTCCPLLLSAVSHKQRQVVDAICKYSREIRFENGRPYLDIQGCDAMERRRTALHIAAGMGSVTMVGTLIQNGANPFMKDQFGMTPLDLLMEMPVAHLKFNNVRAAIVLLKCYPALQPKMFLTWNRFLNHSESWKARLDEEFKDLRPGTFSLTHLSRLKVRETISHTRLPWAVYELPVSTNVKRFLNMEL